MNTHQDKFEWAEDWIKDKLIIRLSLYQKRYPLFDIVRFVDELTKLPIDAKVQRWWPYMQDDNIKAINASRRKSERFSSFAESQS
jgi:L-rhamnose mutarotase